jgi:uncharacterized protein (DUF2141 family)
MASLLLPLGSQAGELKLVLHGTGLSGKNLYVAVHTSAADFPVRDDKALRAKVVATGDTTELLVPNVPAGEYAVAVFADSNGNGKLDNNLFGIPKEPVGVSRNAKGKFGPPAFADAAFRVGDGVTSQTIQLK